jgi:PucR C-terminal helix-turn-helix domain/GGDEF-like domain
MRMESLFTLLGGKAEEHARTAMEAYTERIPDYAGLAGDRLHRAAMLDFLVFVRRRTAELSEQDRPFSAADLSVMAEVGRRRGAGGISLPAHRHAMTLHASLTLREIAETARPHDFDEVRRVLGWISTHGEAGYDAYTGAFMDAHQAVLPTCARIQRLTGALLADDPAAADHAVGLSMTLHDSYLVTVVRIGERRPALPEEGQAEIVRDLLGTGQSLMCFTAPDEFVMLIPHAGGEEARERALELTRRLGELLGLRCAAGVAEGRRGRLAEALAQARQISRVAPVRTLTDTVHQLTDVFVEFGVARTPPIDEWLGAIADRLADGPDLVVTLDVFYHHDMHRLRTAAALHIHPRTLDYRLQRVRQATGLDPASVRGVRALSAAVSRVLSGTWSRRRSSGG